MLRFMPIEMHCVALDGQIHRNCAR